MAFGEVQCVFLLLPEKKAGRENAGWGVRVRTKGFIEWTKVCPPPLPVRSVATDQRLRLCRVIPPLPARSVATDQRLSADPVLTCARILIPPTSGLWPLVRAPGSEPGI